jgi:hypothetical protein
VLGVLHVGSLRPRRFTEEDTRLLQLVADRVALAIEQARLYERERQARAEAERANRSRDEFLATLSRELRAPLQAISGWIWMLRSCEPDRALLARALDGVERNANAQARLIEDLLDVSRIVGGRLHIKPRPVELGPVVEAAVEAQSAIAVGKRIRIQTVVDRDVGKVAGDADRPHQMVTNLLSNALKFTPEDGRVEVSLERENCAARPARSDPARRR